MPGNFYIEGKLEKVNITEILTSIKDLLVLRRSPQSGDKSMTSTYETVYEQSDEAAYIFAGAKIDLTNMEAGDTIDIRARTKLSSSGSYGTYDEKSYTGVQPSSAKVVRITAMPDQYGVEIAMRQTAGVLRTIPCEFFDAKRLV